MSRDRDAYQNAEAVINGIYEGSLNALYYELIRAEKRFYEESKFYSSWPQKRAEEIKLHHRAADLKKIKHILEHSRARDLMPIATLGDA